MSNEIVKSTTDAMQIGEVFFKSGMFTDIKSAQQAVVKIMAGQELGIPPFAAMSGIHIIQGKPTIGAGLMAAKIKGSNKYDYKVVQADEKACIIDFYQGKDKIGTSSFTIEDAKKAGTKNIDKFPKNMLFARAISNGVKWFTPDIYDSPVYVPEEMQDITVDAEIEVIKEADPLEASKAVAAINATESVEELTKLYKSMPKELQSNDAVIVAAKNQKTKFNGIQ
jgi:hypothetical protein